jgi:SAM-dependent methyltransferase
MTVGGFVDYDAATTSYRLPPEHAVSLTRASGPNNLANMFRFESLMGGVEDDIVECMARRFPNSRFTGWDLSAEAIAVAQKEAAEFGVQNAIFEVKDVATIDGSTQFDFITDFITVFDAIHDQAQPARVLEGIAASLRPGGVFLCVDIAGSSNVEENLEHPMAPMLYSVSTFHCMTVSLPSTAPVSAPCGASRRPTRCSATQGSPRWRPRTSPRTS